MGLAWRHPHSATSNAKAWTLAWPISVAVHLLAFAILYFVFTPAHDPLAESNAIGQLRFAQPSEPLEDRPLVRSSSAPSLSSLLDKPDVQDLPLSAMPSRSLQDPRIIGLSSGSNLDGPLSVFSTAPQPTAPVVSFFG